MSPCQALARSAGVTVQLRARRKLPPLRLKRSAAESAAALGRNPFWPPWRPQLPRLLQ